MGTPHIKEDNLWGSIRSVSRELYSLDDTPLLGTPQPFPWDAFSKKLGQALGLENFSISQGEILWREGSQLVSQLPPPHKICHLQAGGLEGDFALVFSSQDITPLMNAVLKTELSPQNVPEEFQEAFFQFLNIEVLSIFNELNYEEKPSIKSLPSGELLKDPALTIDIWVQISADKFLVRLILYNLFRKSWRNYSIAKHGGKPTSDILDKIPQVLHVEVGRSTFSLAQWLRVAPGDFVTIDHIFYDPDDENSRVVLTLNNKPLYSAAMHDGSLEIVEISQNEEVFEAMIEDKDEEPEETDLPLEETVEEAQGEEEQEDL